VEEGDCFSFLLKEKAYGVSLVVADIFSKLKCYILTFGTAPQTALWGGLLHFSV
jgi:hypothetical protein